MVERAQEEVDRAGPAAARPFALRNALLLALLTWLLIAAGYHAAVDPDAALRGLDFKVFYDSAARLNSHQPLYEPHGQLYAYSPLLALLMRPVAHLSYESALKLWFLFNAACLTLSVGVFAAAARMTWRDAVPVGLMLLVGFRCWPTTMNFAVGQVNFLLLLLLAGAFLAESRKALTLLGVLLGIAALFKVWMLGILLYPLLRRQWRAVFTGAAVYGLSVPALFTLVGWGEFPAFVQASLNTGKQVSRISITHSVFGFANLHFRANDLLQPLVSSGLLYGLVLLIGVGAIVFGFVTLWRRRTLSPLEERLFLGQVAVAVLLLLPPCQNEYLVLCLPLLWTLIAPADGEAPPRLMFALGGWLVYLLFSRGWGHYAPVPPAYHQGLKSLIISTPFFAASLLWLAAFLALRSSEKQAAAADRADQARRDGSVLSAGAA